MSDQLPTIDLSTAVVGDSGSVTKIPVGGAYSLNNPGMLRVFNESGCGLNIQFNDGTDDFVPAGAWPIFPLGPNVTSMTWTVQYIIPNAPIAQMVLVYYYPGEPIPQNVVLGNSPIGITGNVTTSSVQSLSNEGNPDGQLVVDIGDVTVADLIKLFTDHFFFKVDQSGTAHSVLQGNTSGNPLQIGQAGDIAEVLGKLTVDQALTALLGAAVTNGLVTDTLDVTGIATFVGEPVFESGFGAPASTDIHQNVDSTNAIFHDIGGVHILESKSSGVYIGQRLNLLSGSMTRINGGSVNGTSGSAITVTHGLGAVPTIVLATPNLAQPGSATIGIGNITSTTFELTFGAGGNAMWLAIAL